MLWRFDFVVCNGQLSQDWNSTTIKSSFEWRHWDMKHICCLHSAHVDQSFILFLSLFFFSFGRFARRAVSQMLPIRLNGMVKTASAKWKRYFRNLFHFYTDVRCSRFTRTHVTLDCFMGDGEKSGECLERSSFCHWVQLLVGTSANRWHRHTHDNTNAVDGGAGLLLNPSSCASTPDILRNLRRNVFLFAFWIYILRFSMGDQIITYYLFCSGKQSRNLISLVSSGTMTLYCITSGITNGQNAIEKR